MVGRCKSMVLWTLVLSVLLAPRVWGQSIPTPESVLGFRVGADFHLATYEEAVEYFQRLAAASDRLQLFEAGTTSEGRTWYFAAISTPENLAALDRFRSASHRLAHPRGLTDDDARALARDGRAIVHIDGGLHATEVAGAQHTIQLAYDLVSNTSDRTIAEILDNVIVMLWPSANPDGQTMVADWYRSNIGTPYEVAPLPRLYQKYIGHDNNRDAYMLNMIESRVTAQTWREWEPQIIYVHHQTAPFPTRIWLPPFAEPIATQAPPLMSRMVNMIGMAIAQGLETKGLEGATHMGTGFDAWYPGYIDYLPMLQNIGAFWTETALYRYATPHFYTISDFPNSRRDLRAETLYPSPWRGGWWRLGDAVQYMNVASMSVLEYAAKYRETILYNRYQAGRNAIEKYQKEPPFAYIIPQNQRDVVAAVELLRRLAFNGIEVHQLTADAEIDGRVYPVGTWVIPMDQEFAELARQVLGVQTYPDLREFPDGPPEQPYDAAGWTLPFQMDVNLIMSARPLSPETRASLAMLEGVTEESGFMSVVGPGFSTSANAAGIIPPAAEIVGSGSLVSLDGSENNAYRAMNRALDAGATVRYQRDVSEDGSVHAGRYVVDGVSSATWDGWANDLSLRVSRTTDRSGTVIDRRVGLYRPESPSMDEGWTRWLLERYEFPFENVSNARIQAGSLNDRFDVIVIAADRPRAIMNGFAPGSVPPRYAGGIGATGVRALDRFVRDGGTLVTFNQSSIFAIEQLHLPVRNVVSDLERHEFFVSGSILEVEVDVSHPVMTGMPNIAKIFVDRSPIFTTLEDFEGTALAKYHTDGSPLLSGYLLGEEHLQGQAAALDVKHGDGHVILLGFRPQWRGQPFGTFRVVFNAILYGGALSVAAQGDEGFWEAKVVEDDETPPQHSTFNTQLSTFMMEYSFLKVER